MIGEKTTGISNLIAAILTVSVLLVGIGIGVAITPSFMRSEPQTLTRTEIVTRAAATVTQTVQHTITATKEVPVTPQPPPGGELVFAISSDPPHLNVALSTDVTVGLIGSPIFGALLHYDEKLNIIPELAEAFWISQDGKTWTFKLRKGVKWHDGRPLTSADVAFSMEVNKQLHPRGRTLLAGLERIETPDEYTVILKFKSPNAALLYGFDVGNLPIATPKHLYENTDIVNNPANTKPIGTGPFKFKEWRKGEVIILERNPDYYRKGYPILDRLVFKIIPDEGAIIAAVKKGQVHFVENWYLSSEAVFSLMDTQGIKLLQQAVSSFFGLFYKLDDAVLKNIQVRKAIAHAIDRNELNKIVLHGLGKPSTQHVQSFHPVFWPEAPTYEYDVAKAESLLDQAGFRRGADGVRFTLNLDTFEAYTVAAEVIKQMLKRVGIEVRIIISDSATFADKVFVKRDFQLALTTLAFGTDPVIGMHRAYYSANIGRLWQNAEGYRNERIDQLMDQATTTLDIEARKQIYREITRILHEDLPILPLLEWTRVAVIRDNVKIGTVGYIIYYTYFYDTELQK
ncbi:MAG: ABC transporter substrate-binding protein [Candidatus Caldarchaeum sp.]